MHAPFQSAATNLRRAMIGSQHSDKVFVYVYGVRQAKLAKLGLPNRTAGPSLMLKMPDACVALYNSSLIHQLQLRSPRPQRDGR